MEFSASVGFIHKLKDTSVGLVKDGKKISKSFLEAVIRLTRVCGLCQPQENEHAQLHKREGIV